MRLLTSYHIKKKNCQLILFIFNIFYRLCYYSYPIFPPSLPSALAHPLLPTFPHFSSCLWVLHMSSLASTFPILFLPSLCLFSNYHLCYLFSVPSPPTPLLITLHVISMSVVLFLFQLFAQFAFVFVSGVAVHNCEFAVIFTVPIFYLLFLR